MHEGGDLVGNKIIVYDGETNTVIAETEVVNFNKEISVMTVQGAAFRAEPRGKVAVLLFGFGAPREYYGTMRKSPENSRYMEIALYNGKTKEGRTTARYPMNAPAMVDNFVIARRLVPLPRPLTVQVVNLSATGCLLHGDVKFFNIGTSFQLKMNLGGSPVVFTAKVVRIASTSVLGAEFGCKFDYPEQ